MEFDNTNVLYKVLKYELFATIAFGSTFGVAFLDIYNNPYLPLKGYQYAIIIFLIFFFGGFFWYGLHHTYISVNNAGEDIIIKYFRILPKFIRPKPKMIKIPKSTYHSYQIERSFFGLRKNLILLQRTKKGVVKYPPISIGSFNADQMNKLELILK